MAARREKVIITCAVTGAIHTPTMTPYLPITPAGDRRRRDRRVAGRCGDHPPACARPQRRAADARSEGVHAVPAAHQGGDRRRHQHHHRRRPQHDGAAAARGAARGEAGDVLAQHGIDELRPVPARPQVQDSGSTSGSRSTWRTRATSSSATRSRTSSSPCKHLGEDCGTKFEFECYDVGHLYNLAHFVDRGLVKPPMLVQTIFGILGGIGPEADNLMHMRRTPITCSATTYHWSILGAGRHQMGLITMGAIMGGHCASGSRTASTSPKASSRRRTPSRWRRSAGSSASSRWRSRRPTRRARCLRSRGEMRLRSEGGRKRRLTRSGLNPYTCGL